MDTLNDEICYFEISNKDDDDSKYVEMTNIE